VLSFAPSFLPYVNELVPDRTAIFEVFGDSNVDWGQARNEAEAWLREERARGRVIWAEPKEPHAGTIIVSINNLIGLWAHDPALRERFAWLRSKRPVAHVGYAYLIFEVREDELR